MICSSICKLGVVVHLCKSRDTTKHQNLQSDFYTVYVALRRKKGFTRCLLDDATIFTDSQKTVACLLGNPSDATQALVKMAKRALWRARDRAGGTAIWVQWCPGHSGVLGSELADAEAKAAVRNRAYPPELLPDSLREHRPLLNAAMVKRIVNEANREAAKSYCRSTPAGAKFHSRYPHLSLFNFISRTSTMSRSSAVLLYRLITSHVHLNQHLHRLRATNTPFCENCESTSETVVHFVLRCPAYADERALHLEALGSDFLHLDFLFSAPEALSPLLDYITATGRFRDSLR